MPAVIIYTPAANAGITTLQEEGGFSPADITQLKGDVQDWVNMSYGNWNEGTRNFRSFNNNTMRQQVNVEAVLTEPQEDEVSIVLIEAD